MLSIKIPRYTVCVVQGQAIVERVRHVRGHHRALELALLMAQPASESRSRRLAACRQALSLA